MRIVWEDVEMCAQARGGLVGMEMEMMEMDCEGQGQSGIETDSVQDATVEGQGEGGHEDESKSRTGRNTSVVEHTITNSMPSPSGAVAAPAIEFESGIDQHRECEVIVIDDDDDEEEEDGGMGEVCGGETTATESIDADAEPLEPPQPPKINTQKSEVQRCGADDGACG
ncbi:hypothetical protein HK102_010071, partial [Quaeritorhiza haematococci]